MKKITFSPDAAFDLFVEPVFSRELLPSGQFKGELGEMTFYDDVTHKRQIGQIKGTANILQRRDASCKLISTPLGKTSTQYIETDALYAKTDVCDNALFHGLTEKWHKNAPEVREVIGDMFQDAIQQDLLTNAYFGNIKRLADTTGIYSWNKYNGIFTHAKDMVLNGTIPSANAVSIAPGPITPTDAYNQIYSIVQNAEAQDFYLASLDKSRKSIEVSTSLFKPAREYIKNMGVAAGEYMLLQDGIELLRIDGVMVKEMRSWNPVLNSIVGDIGHACIYTIRGNSAFATDKEYGEYTDEGKKAFMFWYSKDELTFKQAAFLKAGSGIGHPEHFYFGLSPYSV